MPYLVLTTQETLLIEHPSHQMQSVGISMTLFWM